MSKRITSILLVLVLVFALGTVSAFAEGATLYDFDGAVMSKELHVADGVAIDDVDTFAFSVAAQDGTGTTAAEAAAGLKSESVSIGVEKQDSGDLAVGNVPFSDIFKDAAAFPHAGEYVFKVTETTAAFKTVDGTITKELTVNDKGEEYTVRLYVVNGDDGLEYKGVTVANKAGDKVDPIPGEGETVSGFNFENTYTELVANPLEVSKSITGAYADKTKTFPITVEVTIPSTASESDIALDTEKSDASAKLEGKVVTADLSDGGKIVFAQLPAGSTFVVKETQDSAYQSKTTGFVKVEDENYVAGNVTKDGKDYITESGNTVNIENNREDLVPTGVIIDNLPYALVLLLAVVGVAYLTLKKKAYNA